MEMNSLKKTINDYNVLIKQDSAEFPPETRGGWTLKQQLAKNELPQLQKKYFDSLQKNLFKVNVIAGNPALNQEFAKSLATKASSVVVEDV
jgi:hypothetical protein